MLEAAGTVIAERGLCETRIADVAAAEARAGDVLLVKGSRGVKLDLVVRRLLGGAESRAAGEGRA